MARAGIVVRLSEFLASPRVSPRVVVYGAAGVLLTGLVTVTASAVAPAGSSSSSTGQSPLQRGSLLAAQVAARNSGSRVAVTDLESETSLVYANPDGTVTQETAAAPVRVRDAAGRWSPVDLNLTARDGHWTPKAGPAGLTLSMGGNDALAGLSRRGRHQELHWSGTLPQPTIAGATATYPGVDQNVDLVMRATRLGFEQSLTVKSRPPGQLVYRMPLALPGVTVTAQPGGGYTLTDSAGHLVGFMPQPVMHDAQTDPMTGDPVHSAPLDAKIITSATGTVLQVQPDKAFLDDPATQYPVTLDPSLHLGIVQDTWVASNSTVGYPTATDLRSGKYSGTGAVQRSFIQFENLPTSATIQSATLALYNNQSAGCDTTKQTRAYAVAAPGFTSSTTYANRPGVDSSVNYATATGSYAGTACSAAGWLRWDVTGILTNWNAGATNYGFEIVAADETDTANWKRYASSENGSNSYIPSLAVTYDNYPDVPSNLSTAPVVSSGGTLYSNSIAPGMYATGSDSDGGTVQVNYEIWDDARANQLFSLLTSPAAVGTPTSAGPPTDLLRDGTAYQWRARTYDGTLYSPYTPWQRYIIDITPPPTPSPQLSSASGSSYTFTWPAPSSDTVAYRYGLDDQNPPTTQTTATSVTLTASDAVHQFHLLAVDRAGNVSPTANLAFNQDVTTVTSPTDGAHTAKTVTLSASSRTGWTDVTFRYRKAATDPWTDIPNGSVGDVRDSNGDPVTFPVPAVNNGSASPSLTWDVASTLGRTDGAAFVQACFHDPNGASCSPVTPTITLDQKALGDSYATSDVGPGTVSLVTGNLAVSADDVSDGSGTTSLTVTRTFNTRTPTDPADGMFGPGWLGSLPADSAASDYARLVDPGNHGPIVVTATDGSIITFAWTGTAYAPTGDDAASGLTLTTVSCPAGEAGACMQVADLDGNTTVFRSAASSGTYLPDLTTQPGQQQVSYSYDSNGRLTRALAQPPVNATCTDSTSTATWTAGCRALEPVYDALGHASKIQLAATNPDGSLLRVDVSCYAYDPTGRLTAQWDPRLGTATSSTPPACDPSDATNPLTPNLITKYSYDTTGRLATITPPGQAPFTLTYDSNGRLSRVDRQHTAPSTATETTRLEYDLPLGPDTNDASLRPDLRPAAAATWGQNDLPVTATAVFGPGDTDSRTDLRDGDVTYIDTNSHPVNTAAYANGWHLTTTEYDSAGHVRRTLSAANRELALTPTSSAGTALGLPSDTAAAASWLDTVNQYSGTTDSPGVDLLNTYGPYHQITLPGGGTTRARQHTAYSYDSGNETGHPAGGSLHLQTRMTVAASQSPATSPVNETDTRVTTTEYALSATDNAGWGLHQPMRITEDPGGLNRTTVMRYDRATGLMTEKWMPKASDGSANPDAYKTRIDYYSPTSTIPARSCKPPVPALRSSLSPVTSTTTCCVPPSSPRPWPAAQAAPAPPPPPTTTTAGPPAPARSASPATCPAPQSPTSPLATTRRPANRRPSAAPPPRRTRQAPSASATTTSAGRPATPTPTATPPPPPTTPPPAGSTADRTPAAPSPTPTTPTANTAAYPPP